MACGFKEQPEAEITTEQVLKPLRDTVANVRRRLEQRGRAGEADPNQVQAALRALDAVLADIDAVLGNDA
jgi:hypothetical protein